MIKTILLTGDSHACGQGAVGFTVTDETEFGYDPFGRGIGRNMRMGGGDYINLVRAEINRITGSTASECTADSLSAKYGLPLLHRCVKLTKAIMLECPADLLVVRFAENNTPASVKIEYAENSRTETLCADRLRYGKLSFRDIPIFCSGAPVVITPLSGEVLIDTVMSFSGSYAVIRQGVGSCHCLRFAEDYYGDCVTPFTPHILIAEAHTINDWLTGCTPEVYGEHLSRLLGRMKQDCAHLHLLTVSPVAGSQDAPYNSTPYNRFIEASRKTAAAMVIPMIDANAAMESALAGLSKEERFARLFADNWHVNDFGHKIYADEIMKMIRPIL
ncbi:MAG: SGNH/GDSL hydrolase family protein [Clostridia bacterium]|nr:SGNH/GDSL hydrolase family protein [Clostridia bacterium]